VTATSKIFGDVISGCHKTIAQTRQRLLCWSDEIA